MNTFFSNRIAELNNNITTTSERIKVYFEAQTLLGDMDMTGVESIQVYRLWDGSIEIDFTMSDTARDSKLVHRLTRKFGVNFDKEKSYTGTSLKYVGELREDDKRTLKLEVNGVVPATCQVVETEVSLTAEEYAQEVAKLQKQMAEIPRTKMVREIKCKGAKAIAA